jgi:outer membrane protein OmpA-like peptidoglycan-associated protein
MKVAIRLTVTVCVIAWIAGCVRRAPSTAGAKPASSASESSRGAEADETFEATTTERGEVVDLVERFFFAPGQATLSPGADAAIARVANQLKSRRFRGRGVSIEGHSDSVGEAGEKLRLSEARAEAVAQALIQHGVEAARIQHRGFGDTRPLAPERRPNGKDSPEARARNRRVDIVLDDGRKR